MAVSMNAGYMRSDYMISDAALPMRMEELEQLEQTAKFSEILGEIGNTTATAEKTMTAEEQPVVADAMADEQAAPMLSKAELKALAKAVVRGEVKLDEIPEELVTDVLLTVIAMMMLGVPEDEIPALQEYSEEVQPVQLDVETAEAFINVVKEHENAEITLEIAEQTAQLDIPEEMKQEFTKQIEVVVYTMNEAAANTAAPEITGEFVRETDVQTAEIPAEAVEAVTEQAVTNNAPAQQSDSNAQSNVNAQAARAPQTADSAEQVKLDEEFQQLKKVITEYTVKKAEPEQQNTDVQQTAVVETTAKSRLVSKSDELMMLKNAAKPVQQNESELTVAQSTEMPLTMAAQTPVVFTRADGTEIAVKPEEIIQQVTANIIEQATVSEDGDTEYSLTLNPEDLGSITVKLTKAVDGSLSVSIMAENARTQRIIDQNSAAIQQGLRQNGIELEDWQTVTESQHENRAEDYNGSSRNPYYSAEDNSNNADEEDNSFAELISAM